MVVIIGSTTVCYPTTRHDQLYESPRTVEPPALAVAEPTAVRLSHEEYTVGWICPLSINMEAARAVLDDTHEILPNKPGDRNIYLFGRIGQQNIVITSLEERNYGAVNAAVAATNMHRSFPSICLRMVVGIAGGVPQSEDIRLGDVVVGTEVVEHGLVRKTLSHLIYERTIVHKAPAVFREAIFRFEADRLPSVSNMLATLADVGSRNSAMANAAKDRLFDSEYGHITGMSDCNACGEEWEIDRARRATGFPRIHYGLIASGTQVIKHGETRDKTAELLGGVLCFEVETAGVMDLFPCLAVRGISNYADSHKNGLWEGYASAAAAAYAKELL
ncbi:nucleoside phosphorylase domain-containing protein, partial [Lasiosphaeria miniovina]